MPESKPTGEFKSANDYEGKRVLIHHEYVVTEEIEADCVEVTQSGYLINFVKRGQKVTQFIPMNCIKKVRHLESVNVKRLREP